MPLTMPKLISSTSSPASTASDAGYTRVAIVLHWTLALALTGMFAAGTWMVELPFSPQRLKLYNKVRAQRSATRVGPRCMSR